MKKDDFVDLLGQTDENLIGEVDRLRRRKRHRTRWVVSIAACAAVAVAAVGIVQGAKKNFTKDPVTLTPSLAQTQENTDETGVKSFPAEGKTRVQLLDFSAEQETIQPSVPAYSVEADFSNVMNLDQFYLTEETQNKLAENLFVVQQSYTDEFYELYEYNRYDQIPNYVTVDSLMHTYHLYFSLLLNRTEKNYLSQQLLSLSRQMLETSKEQYDALVGTAWEEAAKRNVAYFSVAVKLQDSNGETPSYVEDQVQTELSAIYDASAISQSSIGSGDLDYTQFLPRGYYAGDEVLEQYFRAMMWYGQVNFVQKDDSMNRSALLMTLAMAQTDLESWERIYTVTSFFAGSSDDLTYYEYASSIEKAYGGCPDLARLCSDEAAYEAYVQAIGQLMPPAINSVPVSQEVEGDLGELNKGFRFMGQRFTIDAAIMQNLVYRAVDGTNEDGECRMLPDTLDVPAALGSDTALALLEEQGETAYGGYSEQMQELRTAIASSSESSWTSSLYSSWIYTLRPLLEEKGEGYPSYMTSDLWSQKALETFAGSFTELKHDTVLYGKQVMAEMGGGPSEEVDDRGYVEPETEVYRRFMLLAQQTAEGLSGYGLLSQEDQENLSRLEQLAQKLYVISRKELQNEVLSDEEYDLIREYGGTLEHFWIEAVEDRTDAEWLDPREIPSSLVTDIATDPNGTVLEIANGRPANILVVVPVDGTLRIASGVVYDFYQFEQPISQRLTDEEWRVQIGQWYSTDESGNIFWSRDTTPEKPWWTAAYWVEPYWAIE